MKYCFYLTFEVIYSDGSKELIEMTAKGGRSIMTRSDIELAREATIKKMTKNGVKIKNVVLVHSLKTFNV